MSDGLFYDEYELPVHRKKRILTDLDEIDDMSEPMLMSSVSKEITKESPVETVEEPSAWLSSLSSKKGKIKHCRSAKDIFNQKKKKKKKKENEPTDFTKEFEPEVNLLNNLLMDQNKFVDSLQQKYDRMESLKSSARGTGKFTTDLIANINQARQLSAQLVDKKITTKKNIAELQMKERKEMGVGADTDDLNNYAANYLKNLIATRGELQTSYGGYDIDDVDEDGMMMAIDASVEDERGDEVNAYLKYENRNVEILVVMNPDDFDDYEFVAEADDGEVLTDYPLPDHNKLSVNRSTMVATDEIYGRKYRIEFRE